MNTEVELDLDLEAQGLAYFYELLEHHATMMVPLYRRILADVTVYIFPHYHYIKQQARNKLMEASQAFSIYGDHQFVAGFVVYAYVNEAKHVNNNPLIDYSTDHCCNSKAKAPLVTALILPLTIYVI